jgi:hypothetical protein
MLCASACLADGAVPRSTLTAYQDALPGCDDEVEHCFGIVLHVVCHDGKAVKDAAWLAEQLSETQRHFAPLKVGFEVIQTRQLGGHFNAIRTRNDRDMLGYNRFTRRVLHLFLVGSVLNIHKPGEEIRGVHWRERNNRKRHWVVLSAIAPKWVLAHEIGHFFGLPHSKYLSSIMNKTPRTAPDPETWSFAAPEIRLMEKRKKGYLFTRQLVPIRQHAR